MIINTEPSFDPASFGATESDYKIAAWKPQKNTRKGFRSIRASFTRRDQSRSDGTSRRPLISAPSDFRHVRSSSHESDMKTSGFGVQSVSRPVGRIPVVSVTQRNHVRPLEYDAHWPYQRISPTVPRFELHRIATSTPPPAYCAERLEQAHVWSQQRGYSSKPGQPGRITSAYDDVSRIPAKSKYRVRAGAALEVDVIRKCLATDVVKAEKLQGQIEDAIEQEGFYDSSCLSTSHSVAPTVPAPLPPAAPSFAARKDVDVKRAQTLTLKVSGPAGCQRFSHEDRKSSKARQCDAGSLSPRLTLVIRPPVRKRDSFSAMSTRMFPGQALVKKVNVDLTTSKPKSVKGGGGIHQRTVGHSLSLNGAHVTKCSVSSNSFRQAISSPLWWRYLDFAPDSPPHTALSALLHVRDLILANPLPIPHFRLLRNPPSHLVRAGQVEGGYEAKQSGEMDNVKDATASLKALATSGHKYRAVPHASTEQTRLQHRHLDEPFPHRSRFRTILTAIMLLAAFLLLLGIAFAQQRSDIQSCVNTATCSSDPSMFWGQYTPYSAALPTFVESEVPRGCKVTFASVLSRHGSRYPTAQKSHEYHKLVERIRRNVRTYGRGYGWIRNFEYPLGENDLTATGRNELFQSGVQFFKRYDNLGRKTVRPFVRTSGSDRVVKSAELFIRGFFSAKGNDNRKHMGRMLIIPEDKGVKNPLHHGNCGTFEEGLHSETLVKPINAWLKIWATPIMNRLNKKMPGANLTLEETVYMMDLCPFNTVASTKKVPSSFCRLFSKREWQSYDYYQSLRKWHTYGPGNPMASTQGVGYVNELIARLTKTPVKDNTTTDADLDSNPATFPLGRSLYADFTHDNTLMTVYSALGLWTNDTVLPTNHVVPAKKANGYSASWTVPFAARMYVEKMDCRDDQKDLVRVLVNDRVAVPKGCKADSFGRCKLNEFIDGLQFAKQGGYWDKC
ncbi:hypothetical protein E4U24_003398 [Claviceps purpurea]|nr:hypothetical protein E4U24_003398 [Claviceps purpurea]KAG6265409.1 hypothetical protein E4U49_001018 [Claviceps purpurea]